MKGSSVLLLVSGGHLSMGNNLKEFVRNLVFSYNKLWISYLPRGGLSVTIRHCLSFLSLVTHSQGTHDLFTFVTIQTLGPVPTL